MTGAGSVEDVFCQTFTAGMPGIGEVCSVALAPGGDDIYVTEANRREYVDAYVDFYLTRSVHHQFEVHSAFDCPKTNEISRPIEAADFFD